MSAKSPEELKIFNDIKMLNWAWIHETEDGVWIQLDCLQCMALESKWHQWQQDPSVTCKLWIGTIDFDKMRAETKKDNEVQFLKIMRTENKNR